MRRGNRGGSIADVLLAALCLLLAAAGLVWGRVTGGPSYAAGTRRQEKAADVKSARETRTTVRRSEGDYELEMTAVGDIQYRDDDSDVESIAAGGRLLIKERRGASVRTLEVVGADGRLRRSYYVQGQARPFDQDARAWLAQILPGLIRGSGANAAGRVRRILGQRGVGGVLEEIALIESDGVRRLYFDHLLRSGHLDGAALSLVARRMARDITSDGEKANLLIDHARLYTASDAAVADYFGAVGTINSDGERARVLSTLLERETLSPANVVRVLNSAKSISSDGEKANVLVTAARLIGDDQTLLSALYDAARTIASDGERARVMSAVERRRTARQS